MSRSHDRVVLSRKRWLASAWVAAPVAVVLAPFLAEVAKPAGLLILLGGGIGLLALVHLVAGQAALDGTITVVRRRFAVVSAAAGYRDNADASIVVDERPLIAAHEVRNIEVRSTSVRLRGTNGTAPESSTTYAVYLLLTREAFLVFESAKLGDATEIAGKVAEMLHRSPPVEPRPMAPYDGAGKGTLVLAFVGVTWGVLAVFEQDGRWSPALATLLSIGISSLLGLWVRFGVRGALRKHAVAELGLQG